MVVGGRRSAEASGTRLRRAFRPVRAVLFDRLPRHRFADPAPVKRLANAPGTLTAAEAGADELLRESLLAQQTLRFERIEHAFGRFRAEPSRRELGREFAARMLAAREQPERPLPQFRIPLVGQVSSASPASSGARFREGSSRFRSAVSIALAMSWCCLRNSRTLSRPWPIRSPL